MSTFTNLPQHNFLNKYSRISPNSPDWQRIEYLLQLSLGSTTATLKNIWAISNPHMNLTFEKLSKVNHRSPIIGNVGFRFLVRNFDLR